MAPTGSPPIVLVVEDEMVLRMRAVDIVEDAGFVPIEAISADQAIQILESRDDISLLFTDIQMPGTMDGLKLAHATHTRWPHIKIILVSGQIAVTDEDKPEDSKFFPKPLEIQQMISEIQEMVGNGALKVMPSLSAADAPDCACRSRKRSAYDRFHQAATKCTGEGGRRRHRIADPTKPAHHSFLQHSRHLWRQGPAARA